jgi:hypothetical protein
MRMTESTPWNQSTIGFERLFEMMRNPVQGGQTDHYPPYEAMARAYLGIYHQLPGSGAGALSHRASNWGSFVMEGAAHAITHDVGATVAGSRREPAAAERASTGR